jgi:hypothetical protein
MQLDFDPENRYRQVNYPGFVKTPVYESAAGFQCNEHGLGRSILRDIWLIPGTIGRSLMTGWLYQ